MEKVRYQDVEMQAAATELPTVHATVVPPSQPIVVAAQPVPVTAQIVGQPPGAPPGGFVVAAAAAPRPAPGRWIVSTFEPLCDGFSCCGPPEHKASCQLWWCACCLPCVVIGQLSERVVRKGSLFGAFVLGEIVKMAIGPLGLAPFYSLELAIDLLVWAIYAHYLLKIRARIRERDQIPDDGSLAECCCAYWCNPCVLCATAGHDPQGRRPALRADGERTDGRPDAQLLLMC
ncbi:hypothetical protein JL722_7547 [Aureococcus anophagefferens]|nr:hypothetical protein JL722_7547 [Aureococcus anophagefferens]